MAGTGEERAEPLVLAAATSRSRDPAAARGTEQKVAGPGEARMKPSSEEEEVVQGVGPWDECFEVAVQLALRAGQVSAVVAFRPSGLRDTPEMDGVGGSEVSCKDRACVVSGSTFLWPFTPTPTSEGGLHEVSTMGSAPCVEGCSHREIVRDTLLTG